MDYWFACCCFLNPFMASNILRYHNRIEGDDCSELWGQSCLSTIPCVGQFLFVTTVMRLLANTKEVPEPTEDVRYLLHSRYINKEDKINE